MGAGSAVRADHGARLVNPLARQMEALLFLSPDPVALDELADAERERIVAAGLAGFALSLGEQAPLVAITAAAPAPWPDTLQARHCALHELVDQIEEQTAAIETVLAIGRPPALAAGAESASAMTTLERLTRNQALATVSRPLPRSLVSFLAPSAG